MSVVDLLVEDGFSRQEAMIMAFVNAGLSNLQISMRLDIGTATLIRRMRRIYRRFPSWKTNRVNMAVYVERKACLAGLRGNRGIQEEAL